MLISCTITSPTKEKIIGPALESVISWVDKVLVVHLDYVNPERPDRTLEIAKVVAGDKLNIVPLACREVPGNLMASTSISDMRNFALREAYRLGGTWACQLDTDERIQGDTATIWQVLDSVHPDVDVIDIPKDDSSYSKHRFFRLPTRGKFWGQVHEDWRDKKPRKALLTSVTFSELPKTHHTTEQRKEYWATCLEGLWEQHQMEPNEHRWIYYLGKTFQAMGLTDLANEWLGKAEKMAPGKTLEWHKNK